MAYLAGLENRASSSTRGFESLPLRQKQIIASYKTSNILALFKTLGSNLNYKKICAFLSLLSTK